MLTVILILPFLLCVLYNVFFNLIDSLDVLVDPVSPITSRLWDNPILIRSHIKLHSCHFYNSLRPFLVAVYDP